MELYKCPIEVFKDTPVIDAFDDLSRKIAETFDNEVINEVHKVGIKVNKDELLKALEYDRGQYEKGHADGYRKALDDVKRLMKVYDVSFWPLERLYKEK